MIAQNGERYPRLRRVLVVLGLYSLMFYNIFEITAVLRYPDSQWIRLLGLGPCGMSWAMLFGGTFRRSHNVFRYLYFCSTLSVTVLEIVLMIGIPKK